MTNKAQKKITSATKILHNRYLANNPKLARMVENQLVNLHIAEDIYEMRQNAGLTQTELAKMVKTTPSVICRLEDADYEGHSLSMLKRIAFALGKILEVRFHDRKKKSQIRKDEAENKQFRILAGDPPIW